MTKIMEKLIKHDENVTTVISLLKREDDYKFDITQKICSDIVGSLLSESEMILTRDFLIDSIDFINEEKEKGFKRLKYNDKLITLGYLAGIAFSMIALSICIIISPYDNNISMSTCLTLAIFFFITTIILTYVITKQEKEILNSKY